MFTLSLFGKRKKKNKEMEQRIETVRQWLAQNFAPVEDGDYAAFESKYKEIEQTCGGTFKEICQAIIEDDTVMQPVKVAAKALLEKDELYFSCKSPFYDENLFIGNEKATELITEIYQNYYQDKLSKEFLNTVCLKTYYCFFK